MPLADLIGFALAALVGLAPFATNVLLARRRERERIAFWSSTAQEAGLTAIEPKRGVLEARAGALRLRISSYEEKETQWTRVEVWGPRLAPGLTLRREGAGFLGRRAPKEIEVGDEGFDKVVSVQGSLTQALALLDPDLRHAFATLMGGRLDLRGHRLLWITGQLDDGVLRLNLPEHMPLLRRPVDDQKTPPAGEVYLDGSYTLAAALRAAVDLAGRLVVPADLAARLAANLKAEPEPGVRRKALARLLSEFPEAAVTEAALRAGRDDPDADVRVRAAVALGKQGRDVLLAVAAGEGAEDSTTARAVAALDTSLTLAETKELLKSALRTRRLHTARACLGILGRLGGAEAGHTLAKVLLVEKSELGEAAAQALAAAGDPAAEAPLLRALAEGPPELSRAAASALGRVGTRAAVLPLRSAEQHAALRAAARQAIAEIHSRLAGAEQGQLSLAEGEAGRLSLVDGEAGHLSLSPEKPGGVRS
jgi:HEAT repeat protein